MDRLATPQRQNAGEVPLRDENLPERKEAGSGEDTHQEDTIEPIGAYHETIGAGQVAWAVSGTCRPHRAAFAHGKFEDVRELGGGGGQEAAAGETFKGLCPVGERGLGVESDG